MKQKYANYTAEDHAIWKILYDRQMEILRDIAAKDYLAGIKKCGFQSDRIPNFDDVNRELMALTGWRIYVVPSLIDNKPFFEHLSRQEFPATTWLRTREQLDYLEEPDMFHDTFGHIPLLSEPFFCDYLQGLSDIMIALIDIPEAVEMMSRLYWFTVEFGLIQEDDAIKIYGAGILSSATESTYSVSDKATHLPYNPIRMLHTPFEKDRFQDHYFVINSYEDLFESLPLVRQYMYSLFDGRSQAA